MAGYVRQAAAEIQPDLAILAQSFNKEFNSLAGAFHGISGHTHDGSAGNGPRISLLSGVSGILPVVNGGTGAATPEEARDNLGVTIGVDVQPFDLDLSSIAGLSDNDLGILVKTSANTWTLRTLSGTAGEITITHGNGSGGEPTVSLPSNLVLTGKTITGGTFTSGSFSGNGAGLTGVPASSIVGLDSAMNGKMDKVGGTFTGPVTFSDGLIVSNGKHIVSQTAPAQGNHLTNKTYVDAASTADRDRANHTGTQSISTISGLEAALNSKISASGSTAMTGVLNMGNNRISNVAAPQVGTDAINMDFLAAWFPTGAVIPYAPDSAPSGSEWLLCNGQAVSRAVYARLFARIGTRYGAGNGSSTFNVPDLRERVVAGGGGNAGRLGMVGLNGSMIGSVAGSDRHQLTEGQMPSHNHYGEGTTSVSGNHRHESLHDVAVGYIGAGQWFGQSNGGQTSVSNSAKTGYAGNHSHTYSFNTNHKGGNQAHPNVQPTMIMNYIIKT